MTRTLAALEDPESWPGDEPIAVLLEDLPKLPHLPEVEAKAPSPGALAHWLSPDGGAGDSYDGVTLQEALLYLAQAAAGVDPHVRRALAELAELQAAAGDLAPVEALYVAELVQEILAGRLTPAEVPRVAAYSADVFANVGAYLVAAGKIERTAELAPVVEEIRSAIRREEHCNREERVSPSRNVGAVADMSTRDVANLAQRFYVEDALRLTENLTRTLRAALDAEDLARGNAT